MFDRLTRALRETEAALAEVDARSLIGTQPADALALITRHERAVAAARLKLTARAEEMNHWQRQGYRSFEDWYAATFGTSPSQARRKARAAKKVSNNDRVADALADGDISEDEADLVADAVDKNPDAEPGLLDTARNKNKSHRDLKDQAARAKAAGEDDRARAERLRRGRTAGWGTDREGFWTLSTRQQPHIGAELKARLDREVDRIFDRARQSGNRETRDRYRADALAALILGHHTDTDTATNHAETQGPRPHENHHDFDPETNANGNGKSNSNSNANGNANANANGGDGAGDASASSSSGDGDADGAVDLDANRHGTSDRQAHPDPDGVGASDQSGATDSSLTEPTAGHPSRVASSQPTTGTTPDPGSGPRVNGRVGKEMVIDINLETLRRGCVEPGETCSIRGVGPVPVEIARQWAHDAFNKAVIRDGTDIRTVAHYGRHIPAHLRTALDLVDPTCAVPGCSNTRIEYDHDQAFADHGVCSTTNLRPLCVHHHRQRTHEGFELTGPPGDRRWHDPDGLVLFADNPDRLVDNPDRFTANAGRAP